MITLEQAKSLQCGVILYHVIYKNADNSPQRWKVNGKVKRWKREPDRIEIPIKHGLRDFGTLRTEYLHLFCLDEEDATNTKYYGKY